MTQTAPEGAKNGLSVETSGEAAMCAPRGFRAITHVRIVTRASVSTHAIADVGRRGVFYTRLRPSLRSKRRSLYA